MHPKDLEWEQPPHVSMYRGYHRMTTIEWAGAEGCALDTSTPKLFSLSLVFLPFSSRDHSQQTKAFWLHILFCQPLIPLHLSDGAWTELILHSLSHQAPHLHVHFQCDSVPEQTLQSWRGTEHLLPTLLSVRVSSDRRARFRGSEKAEKSFKQ